MGTDANAGMVQLFTSDGKVLDPTVGLSQDTAGVGDTTEPGDEFGDKVAFAAPGLGNAATRLVVSAPKENGAASDTSLVQVFPVTDLANEVSYTQVSPNVPGSAQAGEKFGSSVRRGSHRRRNAIRRLAHQRHRLTTTQFIAPGATTRRYNPAQAKDMGAEARPASGARRLCRA